MLTGKYNHAVDAKGRIIIPAKIKEQLGEKFMILKSPSDKCLTLYPMDEWKNYAAKIDEQPMTKGRKIKRYIYANSLEMKPDSQGRIILTEDHLAFAGIEKDIVTVGCGQYAEIWSRSEWDNEELDEKPENLTELLESIGL